MKKQDKVIAIVSIVTAMVLVYIIKPEPINTFCYEWGMGLDDRFTHVNNRFDSNPSEEIANEWMTLQRENFVYTATCSGILIFYS